MKKSIALVAMCATAFSPILSSAAYADTVLDTIVADPANGDTIAAMEDQCQAIADGYAVGNQDDWSFEVVVGAVTLVAGPTEVDGSRVIDETTRAPLGDYVPDSTYIDGDPYRTGGSVNMFGDQYSESGYFPDSTYEFNADFDSTYAHAFQCQIKRAEFIPGYTENVPAMGEYVIAGDFGDSEAAVRGNCVAFTNQGFPLETRPAWWGVEIFRGGSADNPHCEFVGTGPTTIEIDDSFGPVTDFALVAGVPVDQDQTDENVRAFEDSGGPIGSDTPRFEGKVVVCISPSSTTKKGVPGEWRQQNGYTGDKCTTTWFVEGAEIKEGSTTSNGTFISVPDYYQL